ncbi:MAG: TIGR01777 family oxidoreductase [Longimicrobiales bacterium]|nr:TIGR01777 family oxidoreductase [Longimicrobiales bacterium]
MNISEHRAILEHSPEEVFRWHTRPGAFDRLLPPWEDVRVLERTGGLEEGTRVRLRISRGPAHFDWTVEHTEVEEGRSFTDQQVDGPFGAWRHVHRFEAHEGDGCVMVDRVEWEPPLGALASAFTEPLVERELERLFRFRHRRLRHDLDRLAAGARAQRASLNPEKDDPDGGTAFGAEPLTVAITGASGLVGGHLSAFLRAGGHRVLALVRSRDRLDRDSVYWNVEEGEIDAEGLEDADVLVHLAGEPLFALRWTDEKKRRIMESRRKGTRLVSETLARMDRGPRLLVSASGVHFYGDRGDEILTEESGPGEGFLAEVCREWEEATEPAVQAGLRVVTLRTGVVLTPEGGALEKMLLPFKTGLGGRLGGGRQFFSWIDADDHVGLIHHILTNRELRGPVNAVSPGSVPNAVFTDTLGRVLGRPTLVPVPSLAVKVAMGEMGETMLLEGQRARPAAALESGFEFRFPDVEASLRHELGRT